MKTWNHYVCPTCQQTTIAKHEHDGVTPFMVRCRATPGCLGMAQSRMYRGPQDDNQKPHVIWFRPAAADLDQYLASYPPEHRRWMAEHYEKGGCLMREVA